MSGPGEESLWGYLLHVTEDAIEWIVDATEMVVIAKHFSSRDGRDTIQKDFHD